MLATEAKKPETKEKAKKKPEAKVYHEGQEVTYKGQTVTIVGLTNYGRGPQATVRFPDGKKLTVDLF